MVLSFFSSVSFAVYASVQSWDRRGYCCTEDGGKEKYALFETHSLILTSSLKTNTSHVFDIMVIFRKPNDHSGSYSILKLLDQFISNVLKWFWHLTNDYHRDFIAIIRLWIKREIHLFQFYWYDIDANYKSMSSSSYDFL